jgi:phytoene dehydrogenase-like protein
VIGALTAHAPGLRDSILHREVLSPADFESRYGVAEGNLLHGELALDQFLFMRPIPSCARYATPLEGLWLCGSGTHPGAGTAGPSGRLAAREILSVRRK